MDGEPDGEFEFICKKIIPGAQKVCLVTGEERQP